MKAFSTFLGLIFGTALFVALLAGSYYLIRYVLTLPSTLDPQLVTIIASASMVALLCATIIASGLRSSHQQVNKTDSSVEKAYIYKQLLSVPSPWNTLVVRADTNTELERFQLKQRLAVWGSPGVITAYQKLERRAIQEGSEDEGIQLLLCQLIMEMRKDLGQSTTGLSEGDILNLLQGRAADMQG